MCNAVRHSLNMQNLNLFYLIVFLLVASCKEQNNNANSQPTNADTSKTFISEIPTYKHGRLQGDTTYLFKAIREQSKQLNLTNLEKGYDSLEIRNCIGNTFAL